MENGFAFVIAILALVAFSSFIAYDGEKMRSSRLCLGVVLLSALSTFSARAIADFSPSDFLTYGVEYDSSVTEKTAQSAFCRGIKLAISEEFSLSESDVSVRCDGFSLESVTAERVYVTLSGNAALSDLRGIREYAGGFCSGKAIVEVNFE